MKDIQLTKGKVALVDDDKYYDLIKYRWCICGAYAFNRKLGSMHRYLLNQPYQHGKRGSSKLDVQVDHINGDKLDNRLENLRLVTLSENGLNTSFTKGKSKYRGVIWAGSMKNLANAGKPWVARFKPTGGKRLYLGSFSTEEEAAIAYDNAVISSGSSYARLNLINNAPYASSPID